MMTGEILEKLQEITPEEQRILSGEKTIEKEIYMEENSNVIDATSFWRQENSFRCGRIRDLSIFRNIPIIMWR